MNLMNEQWKEIMENNAFSEEAVVTTYRGDTFEITGLYISGSYEMSSPASYGAKSWERGDFFQFSSLSLPSEVTNPTKDLRNAQLSIEGRGIFRVHEVKGANSDMLTLVIQPKEYIDA